MVLRTLYGLTFLVTSFLVGCGSTETTDEPVGNPATNGSDEHADPHDVPLTDAEIEQLRGDTATWAAAVEHLQRYRDTIKTETTGGTPAKAHRSLDLLDHVLEWLPEIAQKNNVAKDDWQSIGENTQKLRDLFNKVHANIDAGEAPDYASVAGEIDAATETLAAIKPGAANGDNSD